MTIRYRVDANLSRFTVQAFASGILSIVGHSPTFAAHDVSGAIGFENGSINGMQLELIVPAGKIELADQVSVMDRREIENRMRSEVLQTEAYPEIKLQATTAAASTLAEGHHRLRLHSQLALHGVTHDQEVNAELLVFEDGIRLRGETPLSLSADEKGLLIRLLTTELGNTRVEMRHTDFSPDYRGEVKKEEALLRSLLHKLGAAAQPDLAGG